MVYWPHVQRRPMKEALDQKTAGAAVHPSSPDVRKPSHVFNRWFIPVGAVAVHICIGSVYAWSTFNRPIQALFPDDPWWFSPPYTTFTTALVLLGLSAAFGGPWVERRGPRVAATAASLFFGIGLIIGGIGLAIKQSILVFLGMGIIGGIGCGLGYISPVSTLIKWFPDRRGMATGMAIMGFGGGAMIGSPLANVLMNHFKTPTSVGVLETFVTMGAIYFVAMLCGAFGYRLPPPDWKPAGWSPPAPQANAMITSRQVHVSRAWKTPQFWLLWTVLCMNVSAGIGVIGMASPMLQEVFGGRLIGLDKTYGELDKAQLASIAIIAAGFAALLSLFNIAGRIFWASMSDYFGRKRTYFIFFSLGIALYSLAPFAGRL